jgi:O-methyltransferase
VKGHDLSVETEGSTTALALQLLPPPHGPHANRQRFLNLMKLSLLDLLYENDPEWRKSAVEGWGWPRRSMSMIGLRRLNNLEQCFEHVVAHGIPGDFIETGVWRGGAAIFMRALLDAHEVPDRTVWVADSFEGMPVPDAEKYPADRDLDFSNNERLTVPLEEVQRNFRRYGLLDDRVRFLKGWFKETLPAAPIAQLSILRLDGDLFESTMDALTSLYPRVSPGGCVIVDDNWVPACRKAVDDYRTAHGISDEIVTIDSQGAYWIKSR